MRCMSDPQTPMPETPWWSTPGATAVLPHESEAVPTYVPPSLDGRRRLPGNPTAWLLALALVAGGGVGGAVAHSLDDNTVSAGSVLSQTRVVGSTDKTISGTPESA